MGREEYCVVLRIFWRYDSDDCNS